MEPGIYICNGEAFIIASVRDRPGQEGSIVIGTVAYSLDREYKSSVIKERTLFGKPPEQVDQEEIFRRGKRVVKVGEFDEVLDFVRNPTPNSKKGLEFKL